jgi:urease beta subunit
MIPGEIIPAKAAIELNTPNNSLKLKVANLVTAQFRLVHIFIFLKLIKN